MARITPSPVQVSNANPADVAATAAPGSSNLASRADHAHAMGAGVLKVADAGTGFGVINATGMVTITSDFTTTSGTYVDITGLTVNLTTTATCTIYAWMQGHLSGDATGTDSAAQLVIDGTAQGKQYHTLVTGTGCCLLGAKTGLVAGTYTVKGQLMRPAGTGNARFEASGNRDGRIMAIAVKEP